MTGLIRKIIATLVMVLAVSSISLSLMEDAQTLSSPDQLAEGILDPHPCHSGSHDGDHHICHLGHCAIAPIQWPVVASQLPQETQSQSFYNNVQVPNPHIQQLLRPPIA
ncbi:hypothetical protein [Pseudobacteriovorax antillogorgiicola]|uniref:Uncharacterized protein n=1 Tax=Pseudobacteriovorax antillogorgiicola TaxID=1513793 RepID=A0A1Y6C3E7_9BACT|nr:hypothetical protein [Pseudobacteriovorax antillogorgiicola]TCS50654.1 hypothetical protein EDD56_11236 [Pseudobacteriovorax antillogorgiicola]SMF39783.1 hypothetical protein SAMN06296036_11235 [Pseudobacteriovorax antillogorgiicola]